jgi:hypothetical protein
VVATELAWPDHLVSVEEAQRWISSVLPEQPDVVGPIAVHRVKAWGVTARFLVRSTSAGQCRPGLEGGNETEVVFKASLLRLFRTAPRIHRLLARRRLGVVPDLIASEERDDGAWMLFRPFEGTRVASLKRLEPLLDIARCIARVQVTVASLPKWERGGLPRFPIERIPEAFDEVLREIVDRNLVYWEIHRDRLASDLHISPDLLSVDLVDRLTQFRSNISERTADLQDGGWPESIDHVDLHTNNAVLRSNESILIYDWEEATLSCPFFSIDRLLEDARAHDARRSSASKRRRDWLGSSPAERSVRDAYLETLPWQTREWRERALELALCLSPIKAAYEGKVFAEALRWEHGCPWLAASAMITALRRWGIMARFPRAAPGRPGL